MTAPRGAEKGQQKAIARAKTQSTPSWEKNRIYLSLRSWRSWRDKISRENPVLVI